VCSSMTILALFFLADDELPEQVTGVVDLGIVLAVLVGERMVEKNTRHVILILFLFF